jgi:thiamine pyrophosphokinase
MEHSKEYSKEQPKEHTGMVSSKCILVCAGELDGLAIERDEGDAVIAVDAGLKYLEQQGMLPDWLVGDFDSLEKEQYPTFLSYRENCPDRIVQLPVEKDDTDTLAALKLGLRLGYRKFYLYGAMGGRIDHTIANTQTLLFAKEQGADAYLMDSRCMVFVIRNETKRFRAGVDGLFSLFSLGDCCTVSIKGMQYELHDAELKNDFPVGTSNEFLPDRAAEITVKNGAALAIYTYEKEVKNTIS